MTKFRRLARSARFLRGLPLELLLDIEHLVLQTQLQLFQPDFFQFFVFREVALVSEGIESLGKLRVLLDQPPEFIMASQELVSRSQHSCGPPGICYRSIKKVAQ